MNIQQKKYLFVVLIITFLSAIIYDQYNKTHYTAWWMIIITLGLVIYSMQQTPTKKNPLSQPGSNIAEYEPIVTRTFTVSGTIENVYNDSLRWLSYIGAGIINKYPPTTISAKHGRSPFNVDDDEYVPIKDWLKTIDINITTVGEKVQVNIMMDSGLKKINFESFERRKMKWPELVDEYMLFVDAEMSQTQKGHLIQDFRMKVLKQAIGGFLVLIIINYFVFSGFLNNYEPILRLSVIGLDSILIWRYFLRLKILLNVIQKHQS